MTNLKKSFFGGYKRSSVDTLVEDLNKQVDSLKDKESSLMRDIAQKDLIIAELTAEIDKIKAKAETLDAENSSLKSEASKNRSVFENVAKIYERAYNAGHDIVLDSKTHSEQMLSRMNQLFYDALSDAEATLARQNDLKQEISLLYGKLDSLISELTNNTDALFKGAENYISVFEDFKGIRNNTGEQAEIHRKNFEDFASEFLSAEEIAKTGTDSAKAGQTVAVEEFNTQQQKASEVTLSPERETEHAVFPDAQEETAASAVTEDNDESAAEVNSAITETKRDETASTKEQKASEFTQFGRKSKVSSADREELIRKALLKNGDI